MCRHALASCSSNRKPGKQWRRQSAHTRPPSHPVGNSAYMVNRHPHTPYPCPCGSSFLRRCPRERVLRFGPRATSARARGSGTLSTLPDLQLVECGPEGSPLLATDHANACGERWCCTARCSCSGGGSGSRRAFHRRRQLLPTRQLVRCCTSGCGGSNAAADAAASCTSRRHIGRARPRLLQRRRALRLPRGGQRATAVLRSLAMG